MQIVAPILRFSAPIVSPPSFGNSGFVLVIMLLSLCVFGYFAFHYILPKHIPPKTLDSQNKLKQYAV